MDLKDLNFRQLEAFSAVMSVGSVTGAAKLLGSSQPTVSRMVQELEATLGFHLLHRNGPRVSPTSRGIAFHAEVESLLLSLGHWQGRVSVIRDQTSRTAYIAATAALTISLVPKALATIPSDQLPHKISVETYTTESLVQAVLSRNVDVGIASYPVEHSSTEIHWMGEAPCVAVMADHHALAKEKVLQLRALRDQRIIVGAQPYHHRKRIAEALAEAGVDENLMLETNSAVAAINLARAGLGVALVEPATSYSLNLPGVAVRPIDATIPFVFGAITALAVPLTPTAQAMIAAVRDVAAKLLPGVVFR